MPELSSCDTIQGHHGCPLTLPHRQSPSDHSIGFPSCVTDGDTWLLGNSSVFVASLSDVLSSFSKTIDFCCFLLSAILILKMFLKLLVFLLGCFIGDVLLLSSSGFSGHSTVGSLVCVSVLFPLEDSSFWRLFSSSDDCFSSSSESDRDFFLLVPSKNFVC